MRLITTTRSQRQVTKPHTFISPDRIFILQAINSLASQCKQLASSIQEVRKNRKTIYSLYTCKAREVTSLEYCFQIWVIEVTSGTHVPVFNSSVMFERVNPLRHDIDETDVPFKIAAPLEGVFGFILGRHYITHLQLLLEELVRNGRSVVVGLSEGLFCTFHVFHLNIFWKVWFLSLFF